MANVPLLLPATLAIAASCELGGLGAREGRLATCQWTGADPVQGLLPWLAILALLALLALKPNRAWPAWGIWLPLAALSAGCHCLQLALEAHRGGLPREIFNVISCGPEALGFGVVAVWLLAPYLAGARRFTTLLRVLLAVAFFSTASFAVITDWEGEAADASSKLLVLLGLSSLVVAPTLVLCGVLCRGRYGPIRLCLSLCVSLLVVCLVLLAPLAALNMNSSSDLIRLAGWGLLLAALIFTVLLPFVVLALLSAFFRARLKALLHLERPGAPGR